MRRSLQEHRAELRVALGFVLAALLVLGLIEGVPQAKPAAGVASAKPLASTSQVAKRGTQGRRGERGPRGFRGTRGPQGRGGAIGATGPDAGPARQFVSIDWQNGAYEGKDRQSFVAPGIGTGEVRCTPPHDGEPTGVQWIRFYPFDAGSKEQPPSRWATTMWTTRVGGNLNDPDSYRASVVRTARLDRANQQSGFNESMNTQTVGHDTGSTGTFTGLITTEPFLPGTAKPPSTSFKLTWHWNFGFNDPDGRCYMAGTFLTKGS